MRTRHGAGHAGYAAAVHAARHLGAQVDRGNTGDRDYLPADPSPRDARRGTVGDVQQACGWRTILIHEAPVALG